MKNNRTIVFVPYGSRLGFHTDGVAATMANIDYKFPQCVCFQQNQREEVRLIGDKAGAITAEGGMHNTNYVYVMSERQISMMVTENVSNSIVSTDYKGAQVVCCEDRNGRDEVHESVGRAKQTYYEH